MNGLGTTRTGDIRLHKPSCATEYLVSSFDVASRRLANSHSSLYDAQKNELILFVALVVAKVECMAKLDQYSKRSSVNLTWDATDS